MAGTKVYEPPGKPAASDMEITSERALAIKRALVRQYAHQNNLEITGWTESDGKMVSTVKIINDKAVIQSVRPISPQEKIQYGV